MANSTIAPSRTGPRPAMAAVNEKKTSENETKGWRERLIGYTDPPRGSLALREAGILAIIKKTNTYEQHLSIGSEASP